jgi:hypothetical protein
VTEESHLEWSFMEDNSENQRYSLRLAVAMILVAAIFVSCTGEGVDTAIQSPSLSATPTPKASPSPTIPPRPGAPADARLEGRYVVRFVVLNSTFGGDLSYKSSPLTISPRCPEGACDVVMEGHIQEDTFKVRLALAKDHYAGVVKSKFATCDGEPDKDTWTFRITPKQMKLIADQWTVSKWEGRWERSAVSGPCLPGTEKTVIRGRLV